MEIKLHQPFSISESPLGQIDTDIIYPTSNSVSERNRLFITCNGDTNKSLIAGQIVCDAIQSYFHSFLESGKEITPDFIQKSIRFAEISIDNFVKEHSDVKDIFTTSSLLFFAPHCIYICQIGESYIAQIRQNQVIYRSVDSSLERKIQGSKKSAEVNITLLKDIRPDDQFFVYSGALSCLCEEKDICKILSGEANPETKLTEIKSLCKNKASASFSAHLIPVKEVEDAASFLKRKMNSLIYSFI